MTPPRQPLLNGGVLLVDSLDAAGWLALPPTLRAWLLDVRKYLKGAAPCCCRAQLLLQRDATCLSYLWNGGHRAQDSPNLEPHGASFTGKSGVSGRLQVRANGDSHGWTPGIPAHSSEIISSEMRGGLAVSP